MTIYKTKWFARFARKQGITDQDLCCAAAEVQDGNYGADLGGGVYKERVARPGGGKSGGFRTILLFKMGAHTFFVYGFPKNARANITNAELTGFRKLADAMLGYSAEEIAKAVKSGALVKVLCDDDESEGEATSE